MASSTPYSRIAISLLVAWLVAACAPARDAASDAAADDARVVSARLVRAPAAALEADLALPFSPVMLDALEHGIPLTLTFALAADAPSGPLARERRLRIAYAPLAQQFQVTDVEVGTQRTFARRAQLLAAFDRVRLPMDDAWATLPDDATLRLSVALDRRALPGPLRLPALFSSDWRLETAEYRWRLGG